MPHPNARISLAERFWKKVTIIDDATSCWLWHGANDGTQGYGRIRIPDMDKCMPAHVLAWQIAHGPIPPGLFILHTCDVKACCRNDGSQSHLYAGTHTENMRDSRERKRHASYENGRWVFPPTRPRGEKVHTAKLSNMQSNEIRKLYAEGWTLTALAQRYGATISNIFYIVKRQRPVLI